MKNLSLIVKISALALFGLFLVPAEGLAQVPPPVILYQTPDVVTYPNSDYGNVIYIQKPLFAPPSPITTYYPISPYMLPRQFPTASNYLQSSYLNNQFTNFVLPPYVIPDWYSQSSCAPLPCGWNPTP